MFYLLFIIIGAAIGYTAAPRIGADPMIGGGLGAAGGLFGGMLVKFLFPILIGLIGAALGAMILLFGYREYRKRN